MRSSLDNISLAPIEDALFKSIINGQVKSSLQLIQLLHNQTNKDEPSIFAVNQDDEGFLHLATKHNQPEIVDALLKKLESFNDGSKEVALEYITPVGETLLHAAAMSTNVNLVELFKNICISLPDSTEPVLAAKLQNNNGQTPLHIAIKRCTPSLKQQSSNNNNKNININNDDSLNDNLNKIIVDCLLQLNFDPCIQDKNGCTPLFIAAQNNQLDIAEKCIEQFKRNHINNTNNRKENFASYAQSIEQYSPLHRRGFFTNNTPLHHACFQGNHTLIELLLVHGAYVNAVNNEGKTPLMLAIQDNHQKAVLKLLEYGAGIGIDKETRAKIVKLGIPENNFLFSPEIGIIPKQCAALAQQYSIILCCNNVVVAKPVHLSKEDLNAIQGYGDSLLPLSEKIRKKFSNHEFCQEVIKKGKVPTFEGAGNNKKYVSSKKLSEYISKNIPMSIDELPEGILHLIPLFRQKLDIVFNKNNSDKDAQDSQVQDESLILADNGIISGSYDQQLRILIEFNNQVQVWSNLLEENNKGISRDFKIKLAILIIIGLALLGVGIGLVVKSMQKKGLDWIFMVMAGLGATIIAVDLVACSEIIKRIAISDRTKLNLPISKLNKNDSEMLQTLLQWLKDRRIALENERLSSTENNHYQEAINSIQTVITFLQNPACNIRELVNFLKQDFSIYIKNEKSRTPNYCKSTELTAQRGFNSCCFFSSTNNNNRVEHSTETSPLLPKGLV